MTIIDPREHRLARMAETLGSSPTAWMGQVLVRDVSNMFTVEDIRIVATADGLTIFNDSTLAWDFFDANT